jgi:lipid II:glycine glycyltransferase (peptidoglycan interpeptide bridge formation enzyme)
MTTPLMLDCFEAVCDAARTAGFSTIAYKTVPSIYHRLPAEEDRYALFRFGAQLHRRDVLSVIERDNRGPVQERRRRGVKRAAKAGVVVEQMTDFAPFWAVLEATLGERHGMKPVHTLAEIHLLASRFPQNVQLFVARMGAEVQAGIVMYVSAHVAHAQYIAATPTGREAGALDLLVEHLVTTACRDARWFDFGISNEDDGRFLNTGLIEQKEGFGARAFVHDHYTLALREP